MKDITVNEFRKKRGLLLGSHMEAISKELGRPLHIFDVGGRPDYWGNVPLAHIGKITFMNYDENELKRAVAANMKDSNIEFEFIVGDARNLSGHEDQSADLVHANSVIEHVGAWWDMRAMANEVLRVGRHGWIQTPAFEFPIEPHYKLPFVHWFGLPIRRKLLWFSGKYRQLGISDRRTNIDRINLLTYNEFRILFPDADILRERVVVTKSYTAKW